MKKSRFNEQQIAYILLYCTRISGHKVGVKRLV
jgi:hypothetical protein